MCIDLYIVQVYCTYMRTDAVFRELLRGTMEEKAVRFTVRGLAESTGVPPSTVSHALRPLKGMGAIKMERRGFRVVNARKALLYWCSARDLPASVVYSTRLEMRVEEIEGMVPPGAIFTAYTAFRHRFGTAPSEYGEVYAYGSPDDFAKRFGEPRDGGGVENLIVLAVDEHLKKLGKATLAQIYVDLWNIPTWYAQDFIDAMEGVI